MSTEQRHSSLGWRIMAPAGMMLALRRAPASFEGCNDVLDRPGVLQGGSGQSRKRLIGLLFTPLPAVGGLNRGLLPG